MKGCVMVKCAVWLKEFLEARVLSFSDCFYFKLLCADVTHPQPLSRGEIEILLFYLKMNDLACRFPLLRGDQGVCYGEVRDLAQRVFRGEVPWL